MVGLGRCYGFDLFEEAREQYLMTLESSPNCLLNFLLFLSNCKSTITQRVVHFSRRDELDPSFNYFQPSRTGSH